jgi:hypothetical protein
MANQLLPPPDLAPPLPLGTSAEQRIALWIDLMDACEQFLLAGLRRKVGGDGDIQAAYRTWYAAQMEEHDRMMRQLMERFAQRREGHAR